ncbi:hypothetical protein [Iningainema tapete]|uniref:Uncharacterized protein n=1 Tax=Iningainema tapete BLCC-T55 TaxID=2748662 RepID=A0A8J6XN37_9CYAN|nr:hypothetical protein [Iningainema tapete]MBD2776247.1 hypothetical protein [Iningainema tapete BLCC-T55]
MAIDNSNYADATIASIRGIVEIKQTEIDRSLEKTIQVVGVGLAPHNPPHPFYASLLLSILATLFFSIITWRCTQRK